MCDARCLNYTRDLAGGSFLFIKREGAENWRRFESQRNEQKYYGLGEAGELAETGREAWWGALFKPGYRFSIFYFKYFFSNTFRYPFRKSNALLSVGVRFLIDGSLTAMII